MKIDIGCGPNKKQGFTGIDAIAFPGVDYVCKVGVEKLPFPDNFIEEAHTSHFVEHLTQEQRIQFVNELYRVLKPGAKATIICPYWASGRAYGDLTHQWPPVTDFWFYYLGKEWRMANAPHNDSSNWAEGYSCNFSATWGYVLHGNIITRNTEYQEFAATFYKEAIQDVHATLTKL